MVRRVLGAAVVALVVGATLGPIHPAVATPARAAAEPAFVGVPASDQTNNSPYPVLQRLGRWDGSRFVRVDPRSIRPGPVIVMSHGWSPGYRDVYERLQAGSDRLVTAWDPQMVDAKGVTPMVDFDQLAEALHRADPLAAVLMFSWIDQSATGGSVTAARYPEQATEVNGHRMAAALDEALAPDFSVGGGQVHLIGHSFGANVVATAALALTTAPDQVTLLDSPEVELARIGGAKNDLQYKLPRLNIGREAGQTFVDNYISLVGERYSTHPGLDRVVDVRTAPPSGSSASKHTFAIRWYTDSVTDTSARVGYAWSPLTGADDAGVGTAYEQPSVDDPLALNEVEGPPPRDLASQLVVGDVSLSVVGQSPGPDVENPVLLSGSGPITWNLTFTTTEDALWLTFDASIVGRRRRSAHAVRRWAPALPDGGGVGRRRHPGHVRDPLRRRTGHPRAVGRARRHDVHRAGRARHPCLARQPAPGHPGGHHPQLHCGGDLVPARRAGDRRRCGGHRAHRSRRVADPFDSPSPPCP